MSESEFFDDIKPRYNRLMNVTISDYENMPQDIQKVAKRFKDCVDDVFGMKALFCKPDRGELDCEFLTNAYDAYSATSVDKLVVKIDDADTITIDEGQVKKEGEEIQVD